MRRSGELSDSGRGCYFDYLLVLSQTLTMIGYLLPWSEQRDGALLEAYSDLTHDPTQAMLEMGLITFGCFIITLSALAFTCYTVWRDDSRGPASRAASLTASITLAGPLVYVQTLLQFSPDWSDLYQRLADMGPGWSLAVLFGAATVLVGIGMIRKEHPKDPASSGAHRLRGDWESVLMVILAVGFVTTIIGYLLEWSHGDMYTMYGPWPLSKSGTDEGPLMCIVPVAAGVALFLAILSQVSADRAGAALLHASRCMATMGLSLTFFWGLVIGDYEVLATDLSVWLALQPGWYIFLAGQAAMLASLIILRPGGWMTADADKA